MILFTMARTKRAIVFLSVLFLLAGCNTLQSHVYSFSDNSFSDYTARGESSQEGTWIKEKEKIGYREEILEPDVYVVTYIGKVGEPSAVSSHWALKRAAELALSLGSDGFVIVGMKAWDWTSSKDTTYQWIGKYQYTYEKTTHKLPHTVLVVLMVQGGDNSFLFNPKRVLSWYEAADQRHRESNKMFDARGTIERHFKYFTEKNVPMMRSIVNSPPKDVYFWEAGLAEGQSRIYFAIDEAMNTVTHIWVDKQHMVRAPEDGRDIWIDLGPGEHRLEIAVYTWFLEQDNPREAIAQYMLVTTNEGELYWVRCPPKFGAAKGSFVVDGPGIQKRLNNRYKWK